MGEQKRIKLRFYGVVETLLATSPARWIICSDNVPRQTKFSCDSKSSMRA